MTKNNKREVLNSDDHIGGSFFLIIAVMVFIAYRKKYNSSGVFFR